jgi:hypothetical protein
MNESTQIRVGNEMWNRQTLLGNDGRAVGILQWRANARRIAVGQVVLPPIMIVTLPSDHVAPDVRIRIEVVSGVPVCTSVKFTAVGSRREVNTIDLRKLRIQGYVDLAVAATALDYIDKRGVRLVHLQQGPTTRTRARAAARGARAPRKITPEFLQQVAQVYRDNIHHEPLGHVAKRFNRRKSSAAQYVRAARVAGYLPPTTKGKKNA